MREQTKGSLMLLVTSLIWGTAFVAQSEGMNYVEPFTYNAIRTLIGGITLIPVVLLFRGIQQRSGEKREYSRKNTIIGGVCCGVLLFAASSFQQAGIARTTAGKAGFITALYIVIVPLMSIFLGKRPPARSWIFVGIATVGFWLLCMKEGLTLSRGDLLVLVCAFIFALHIIVIDRFNAMNTDGVAMSCIQFFTAGLLMLVCMFIFEKPQLQSIIAARITILYTGVMSCSVAYTLQILGQKKTPPTIATLLMSLESVFAALSGCLILHERLSVRELTGCILVFAAVILMQMPEREKEV